MGLRFFTDHCVPNSIIRVLRDAGYEVLRLTDYIPADSIDSVVVSKAQELDAILVSLDADFADIVAYPPAMYSGIIALQVGNHPEVIPRLAVELKDYLSAHPDMSHYDGKLLLVEAHRIRVRE